MRRPPGAVDGLAGLEARMSRLAFLRMGIVKEVSGRERRVVQEERSREVVVSGSASNLRFFEAEVPFVPFVTAPRVK